MASSTNSSTTVPTSSDLPPLAISRLANTRDNRTSAARRDTWLEHVPAASSYDAVALSKETEEAMRSESSAQVHKAMRADYVAFCARVGVDPCVVTSSTAAHVANFYKYRTKNFRLGLSMAKHVSAQMTLFFKELGCSGQWSTGKVGMQDTYVNGNPNYSDDVAKCKRAHKAALAAQGRVPVPIDALEYGHMCAYYDHYIKDQDNVDPARLCQFAAMIVATFNLMRFDEVTKIQYVGRIAPAFLCSFPSTHVRSGSSGFDHWCLVMISLTRK